MIITKSIIMNIFSKRLLLNTSSTPLNDDYLMASSKKILAASSSKNFLYKNDPQILEGTLSSL